MHAEVVRTGQPVHFQNYHQPTGRWYESYVSRVGGAGSRQVALVFDDVTARKHAEENLAFLADISYDFSRLTSEEEIMETAGRKIGTYLKVATCNFVDVSDEQDQVTIYHAWNRGDVPNTRQTFRLADFVTGEFNRAARAGETFVIGDTQNDERADAETYARMKMGSLITVPYLRNGRYTAHLAVTDAAPREWQPDEIALLENITSRLFPRIERARAEEALSESEGRYRLLFSSIDEGYLLVEVLFDESGRAIDIAYVEANPAVHRLTDKPKLVGLCMSDVEPGFDPSWAEVYGQVVLSGEPLRLEYSAPHGSDERWFDFHMSRVGDASSRCVAVVFQNITERKRAEKALQESEARQLFLLQLSDALAPLTDAVAIQEAVTRVAREFFQADRCYYGEIEDGQCIIRRDASLDALPSVAGVYALRTMPLFNAVVEAGRPFVVEDVHTTELVDDPLRQLCAQLQVISFVDIPVIKNGKPLGVLCVVQGTPRHWAPLEVELAQEVAERTWAAVERAKAEEALRASQERQAFLLKLADALRPLSDPAEIQAVACRILGEYLQTDRTYYAAIDLEQQLLTVEREYVPNSTLSVVGTHPLAPFASVVEDMKLGRPSVVSDVEVAPQVGEVELAALRAYSIRAFVSVPLIKRGRLVAGLLATSTAVRTWAPAEIELQQEVAERTWAAVERACAEQAQRESEARLRTLIDNLPGGAAFIVGPDLRYQLAAGEALLAAGGAPADFVGRTLAETLPSNELALHEARYRQALAGQPFVHEHEAYGRAFVSRGTPLRGSTGEVTAVLVVSYDITDRRRAEDALWQSDERLRIALEAAELGTWDWDLATNEVYWNARQFTQFGLEPSSDPVTPADFERHVHPDDRPAVLQLLRTAVAEQQVFQAEFWAVTAQGTERWISGYGQVTDVGPDGQARRMSGVMLDITERKVERRTQALQQSRDLLQSVYDTSLIGMAVVQAVRDAAGAIEDFTFVSVNRQLEQATGRPDLVGKRYGQEFPGVGPSGLLAQMRQVVETGTPHQGELFYPYEEIMRWFSVMHVKLDDGAVITTLDITERKQAEAERDRQFTLLQQAEGMAELGSWEYELATGAFHWSAGMYRLFDLPEGTSVQPGIYLDYALADDLPAAERLVHGITQASGGFEETLRLRVGADVKTVRVRAVVLPGPRPSRRACWASTWT